MLKQAFQAQAGPLVAACAALAAAGGYYVAASEPPAWLGYFGVGLGCLLAAWWRVAGTGLVVAGAVLVLAGWQVQRLSDIDYANAATKDHWVVGRVAEMKPNADKPNRVTLVLEGVKFYQLGGWERVKRAHIGVYKTQVEDVAVGSDVAMPVLLLPPEGPKWHGGFDARLWRFLQGDVVYGYTRGTVEPTWRPDVAGGPRERFDRWLDGVRERVFALSRDYAGGTVAALLVGNENGVGRSLKDAYKAAGLSHLLAISGMQLTLVAMGVFWLLRRGLVGIWPGLALRINVKMWSAIGGLVVAAGYTLLAGAGVSLLRAFVMTCIVMLAIVAGRTSSLLRVWAITVVLLVFVNPAMVVSAGFLLSIFAVLGLVVMGLCEFGRAPHGLKGLRDVALASVFAGAFTAPILVWKFGQFSVVSLLANMVGVPLMTGATYLSFIGLMLMPLGWQGFWLWGAGVLAGWVNAWALWLASWPWASLVVEPRWWPVVLVGCMLIVAAAVWRKWSVAAVVFMVLAGVLAVWGQRAPAEVAIWDDGNVGWAWDAEAKGYRLLWAENGLSGYRLSGLAGGKPVAALGGYPMLPVSGDVPDVVDERYMPVTGLEHFAWAERRGGVWHVEPVRCGRRWEC